MNSESNRLDTFDGWPLSTTIDPQRLARGGFFYNGQGTEVQCFSCNVKISDWNYGDQVMRRHRLEQPCCVFLENPSLSGNICMDPHAGAGGFSPEPFNYLDNEVETSELDSATQDYGHTEDDEMYKSDALRLLSFAGWEDQSASTAALVQAGFYHAGAGKLRCAWCGGELANYSNIDHLGTPLEIHRIYFPRCDHAATLLAAHQNWDNSSLALSASPYDSPPSESPQLPSLDNGTETSGAEHNARILRGSGWRSLGLVSGGVRHPNYSSLQARRVTFEHWPENRTQTPLSLAEAGFFYTGVDDQVRCFYCDGGLGRWEANDTPWIEHAKWFPHCGYVLLVKGQKYVYKYRNLSDHRRRGEATPQTSNTLDDAATLPRQATVAALDPSHFENTLTSVMEGPIGLAALSAGLDAARVRRAIAKRLRNTGTVFNSAEALIDAALNEQLNEVAWSAQTGQPNTRRIVGWNLMQRALDDLPSQPVSGPGNTLPSTSEQTDSSPLEQLAQIATSNPAAGEPAHMPSLASQSRSEPRSLLSETSSEQLNGNVPLPQTIQNSPQHSKGESDCSVDKERNLAEENRQLKESRICKVCMDNDASVVFLPCGHLLSCARCGAALRSCPLCRCPVKALVRAYLA